ncbi:MAG: hypothetical protein P8P30_01005, partial [Rickettsiales bacterium]|nr:hypothetical protein [Rickettsiales bacterium]
KNIIRCQPLIFYLIFFYYQKISMKTLKNLSKVTADFFKLNIQISYKEEDESLAKTICANIEQIRSQRFYTFDRDEADSQSSSMFGVRLRASCLHVKLHLPLSQKEKFLEIEKAIDAQLQGIEVSSDAEVQKLS